MKIDLEDDGVFYLETDKDAVRAYFDGKDIEECIPNISNQMDEAQGYTGIANKPAYIVIEVKP